MSGAEPRAEFYQWMDAANIDLKPLPSVFYHQIMAGIWNPYWKH